MTPPSSIGAIPKSDRKLFDDCRWLEDMGVVIREDDAGQGSDARSLALVKGDEILIACIIVKPDPLDQLRELIGVYKTLIFQPWETRH